MKKYDRITPEGTRDLLFEECVAQRKIINNLRETFEGKDYNEVITPGFEFYDVFSSNAMYFPQESMYKLMDNRGRLITMRPDSTIPIARMTATKLKGHKLPIRLYYAQKVYRPQPELRGKSSEIMQMGIELIGLSTFESDIEVLTTGIEALSACSTNEFRIELGHIGVFKLLMKNLNTSEEEKENIHALISSKNYAALSDVLEGFAGDRTAELLKELPKLFGGKEALDKARTLFDGYDPKLMNMISYLERIYQGLMKLNLHDKIMIDFGLVNQAEYYSSLIFRGYIASAGEPVLSGGRYDELFKDFGEDLPAIGFGINVDQLAAGLLEEPEKKYDINKNKIRIALTKGRLEKSIVELFEEIGYDVINLKEKGRKLLLTIPNTNIEVVLAKAADVITYVEHGVCDIGVVGKDTIVEHGGTFYEVIDLGIGKCKFALAAPKGTDFYSGYSTKTIATKYPKVAGSYFESKCMDIEIIKIEGSVELAPLLDLADGIVDLVETGTTLKENGLEVIEDIRDISARLIVNEASMKLKKNAIDDIIAAIERRVKK
ncbi:ATP phosphoribosyltransferase regulatory subunit [Anaerovorax odorimutans]|uniref:ATP phosphoribosyltransferase regulatory subunit n=1 Tax=Anaerovorax odorimutans TaxID=109327 RepID=UPI0003FAA0EC|nr:ATP phosphoribosyltransferase regulatory subunit [Anaerovorax odorimutans]